MKKKTHLYLLFIICLLIAPILTAADEEKAAPASPVRAAKVKEASISSQISVISTTEAIRHSTVASEVSGRVEKMLIEAGDYVRKGDPLIKLNSTTMMLRLKGATAGKQALEAKRVLAGKELERIGNLKDANSVAAKQYDEAYFNYTALTKELEKSTAEIELLEHEIAQQTVTSPFDGFVAEKYTQVGEWMQIGGRVIDLVDLSDILVMADVAEKYAVHLIADNPASVLIQSVSEQPFTGRIEAVLPQGNPTARTFPVRIKLSNPEFRIKSGMEAVVTFDVGRKFKTLLVPKDAIVPSGEQNIVFRIDEGKVYPVSVKVTAYYQKKAAITGDLKPNDTVVIRGNERLRPGQTVNIIDK
jgi:RND family efflux transporter MFP subunit